MTARAGVVAALVADFSPRRPTLHGSDTERASEPHRTRPDSRGCESGTSFQRRRCSAWSTPFAEPCDKHPGHVGRHINATGSLTWV